MKTQIKQCSRQACDKLTVIFLKYLRVSPSRTKNLLCQTLSTFFFLNRNPFLWPEDWGGGGGREGGLWYHMMSGDKWFQMVSRCHVMSGCITWCHMMSGCITWHHMMSGCITWCQVISHDVRMHHMMSGASHDVTWCQDASHDITWCQDASHDVTWCQDASHDVMWDQVMWYCILSYV